MQGVAERQQRYLQELDVSNVIPDDQRHRYHALFGMRIINSFDTLAEAHAAREEFKHIHVAWYCPPVRRDVDGTATETTAAVVGALPTASPAA